MKSKVNGVVIAKLLFSLVFDVVDFFIGFIPGVNVLFDTFGAVIALWFWKEPGVIALWEIVPTPGVDNFIPTLTIAGILSIIGGFHDAKR